MPADPLALRDQLLAELEATHVAEHEARLRVRHCEGEIERTANRRMELYTERARGRDVDGKAMAGAESDWADAQFALERFREQLEASRAARTAVENDLKVVYREFIHDFAAEAESSTALARTALEELEAPLAQAHRAWAVAAAAWAPLAAAIAETLVEAEAAAGVWRDHGQALAASRVPALKLPPPGFAVGHPPARPPGLRLSQEVGS